MDQWPFDSDGFFAYEYVQRSQRYSFLPASPSCQTMLGQNMSYASEELTGDQRKSNTVIPATTSAPVTMSSLDYQQVMDQSVPLLPADWQFSISQTSPQHHQHSNQPQRYLRDSSLDASFGGYGSTLTSPPAGFMPNSAASISGSSLTLNSSSFSVAYTTSVDPLSPGIPNSLAPQISEFEQEAFNMAEGLSSDFLNANIPENSPVVDNFEIRSLSSSDNGWNAVDFVNSRRSFDSYTDGSNAGYVDPMHTLALHVRSNSDSGGSDIAPSIQSSWSYEEVPYPLRSPQSEANFDLSRSQAMRVRGSISSRETDHQQSSPFDASISPSAVVAPMLIRKSVSSSSSPPSSNLNSPPTRRRKSPISKVTKSIIRKTSPSSNKKDCSSEKRIGKRKGPLRPDQRQQAHEIRKIKACIRCKFLKKTCDKGDPCTGCKPSHARLWQVPCTRIDIKEVAYFMKDWKADFERHVTLSFSVHNIKGFSPSEKPLYVTHGYGFYIPIKAREVYVHKEDCFGVDWVESNRHKVRQFEVPTARLSAGIEGVSRAVLSEYLDNHLDNGFEGFVDEYFGGTAFVTEIVKTVYRFYLREQSLVIRKALKLLLAYNLTQHVTHVEGLSDEERQVGMVDDEGSKYYGKTVAPVMINFQVKCALADMWRELQKDVLEELSSLYSSVYCGEKLKNWPTIFMLVAILLLVWEEMQFDCHYRIPDQTVVKKFCDDMESTPVGVIVGLFSAISQKLPSFVEWDSKKHHHLLNSNPAVCDAMTEVREHVLKYETYLKTRAGVKFNRCDFDSLSNKFLAKLVIRAN